MAVFDVVDTFDVGIADGSAPASQSRLCPQQTCLVECTAWRPAPCALPLRAPSRGLAERTVCRRHGKMESERSNTCTCARQILSVVLLTIARLWEACLPAISAPLFDLGLPLSLRRTTFALHSVTDALLWHGRLHCAKKTWTREEGKGRCTPLTPSLSRAVCACPRTRGDACCLYLGFMTSLLASLNGLIDATKLADLS